MNPFYALILTFIIVAPEHGKANQNQDENPLSYFLTNQDLLRTRKPKNDVFVDMYNESDKTKVLYIKETTAYHGLSFLNNLNMYLDKQYEGEIKKLANVLSTYKGIKLSKGKLINFDTLSVKLKLAKASIHQLHKTNLSLLVAQNQIMTKNALSNKEKGDLANENYISGIKKMININQDILSLLNKISSENDRINTSALKSNTKYPVQLRRQLKTNDWRTDKIISECKKLPMSVSLLSASLGAAAKILFPSINGFIPVAIVFANQYGFTAYLESECNKLEELIISTEPATNPPPTNTTPETTPPTNTTPETTPPTNTTPETTPLPKHKVISGKEGSSGKVGGANNNGFGLGGVKTTTPGNTKVPIITITESNGDVNKIKAKVHPH